MLRESLNRANEMIQQMSRNESDQASSTVLPMINGKAKSPEKVVSHESSQTRVLN